MRVPWLLVLTVALTVGSLPARAAPVFQPGANTLDSTLVVAADETLDIGPGVYITGGGSIEVHGALNVTGASDRRVEIAVPIVLLGNGSSHLTDARLWGVNGTALTVRSGNLTLRRVAFEGNGVGLAASTAGSIVVRDALFRAHAVEAARVTGASAITIENASVEDGRTGLVLDLTRGAVATLGNSSFQRNAQHALVQLGPEPVDVRVTNGSFGAPRTDTAPLPSLTVRGPPSPDGVARSVALVGDSFVGADVGLRVEGSGFVLSSTGDAFLGDRVGVSLGAANVALANDTFSTRETDIEGRSTSVVRADHVQFTPTPNAAVVDTPASPGLAPWVLPTVGAVVATGGAVAILWRRGGGHGAVGGGSSEPQAEPALVPPPTAPGPPPSLSPMERRVLDDVVAHPGSAQAAIAARLGLSRQALHYHVKKLEARALLSKTPEGRETRCEATPLGRAALAASPAAVQLGSEEKP